MNMTILMGTLFLAGATSVAAATLATVAPSANLLLAQDIPYVTPDSSRTDRINRNTDTRTDNRVERREAAADAAGVPGLDRGIARRNDRREDRRIELRTGQAPESMPAASPVPQ